MDEVDAVPRPRRQRPKDSFQNELHSKLRQRKNLGLTAEVTDSDEDGLGSLHNTDYRSKSLARPGSAKYRSDKSPDLSRGLGTTTMRSRDLTQLLSHSGGHSDDDDDEEVMAATLGKSRTSGSSWQPHGYKTPSPKQDSKFMRKTPTGGSPQDQSHLDSLLGRKNSSRESPKEQSKLDSIFGRKTPNAESPKEQSRLESLYGRKTPTKESPKEQSRLESLYGRKTPTKDSPKESGKFDLYDRKTPTKDRNSPGFTKEDVIFGRKTPTSDGRRLPGMDGASDRPWQPPNFRSMTSPNSSPDHSRGSRGVTPTESVLDPINETPRDKVTPRLQRGERLRNDESPNRQVSFGERPKPQARSKIGDRKTSPTLDPSPTLGSSSMKRATPTMDLFGKTRSTAANEVEDYMDADKKGKLSRDSRKTPDSTRSSLKDRKDRLGQKDDPKRSGSRERSPSLGRNSRIANGKKTPTGERGDLGRKSPFDKSVKEDEKRRKSPYDKSLKEDEKTRKSSVNQSSSLLDFLTGSNEPNKKVEDSRRERKLRTTEDDLDNLFASNRRPAERKSLSNGRLSPDQFNKKPSISGRKSPEESKKFATLEQEKGRDRNKLDVKEKEKSKEWNNEDASSVCDEIPMDPAAKLAKAEEKARKSGKQTSERAKTDNIIDTIAGAQTMKYIEPARKVRPVTAEAKVQHRPKPRYGALPGTSKTDTMNECQFNSTVDIRDAIYEEWYADRIKQAKKKKKEEEKKKKEEEEKKKKEEEERKQEALLSYKAWANIKKDTVDKVQAKKKRIEEAKKEKEIEEREEKREASKKLFEHWKQGKDVKTRNELRQKKDKEEEERRVKEDEEYRKRKDKETAFRGWQNRKELELKRQKKNLTEEKKNAKLKKEEEAEEERRKEEEVLTKYNDWMAEKEKQKHREKRRYKHFDETEERPAWSPASRTIPFGR